MLGVFETRNIMIRKIFLNIILILIFSTFLFSQEEWPYDPEATVHFERAIQLKAQGQYIEAEREYLKAIAIDPTFDHALYNLGNLYIQLEQYHDAISMYDKILSVKPKYKSAYYNLGLAYKFSGQPEQAVVAFGDAILIGHNTRIPDSLDQIKELLPQISLIESPKISHLPRLDLKNSFKLIYKWDNARYGRPYFFSLTKPDLWVFLAQKGKNVIIQPDELINAELIARLRQNSRLWNNKREGWDLQKAKLLLKEGQINIANGSITLAKDINKPSIQLTIDVKEKYWEYKSSKRQEFEDYHILYKFDAKVKIRSEHGKASDKVDVNWPEYKDEKNVEQDSFDKILELVVKLEQEIKS
jgi:tetratricopeptide (TPR) repeat protein